MKVYYLYHLVNDNQDVVYVGMTQNPKQRYVSHRASKPTVVDMLLVNSFEDSRDCALAELLEILTRQPEYNLPEIDVLLGRAERQRSGIQRAKDAGKYRGRKKALDSKQVDRARSLISIGVPKAQIARDLGVSRQTLYTALDE